MRNKYRIVWVIVIVLLINKLSAQEGDTIFIYEEVIVYDTVVVYDTVKIERTVEDFSLLVPKGMSLLQIDTTGQHANLLIISGTKTATIPINSIILNGNIKNLESMKKISFFGVMLFAFQSMVMSQSDFGISAGGGSWWAQCNEPVSAIHFSPTFNAGVYFDTKLIGDLYLQTELNYHYLMSNYSYKASEENLAWETVESGGGAIIGDIESASDYHQIAVPVKLGYQVGKFRPYLGAEYNYRISEYWLEERMHNLGLKAGLQYKIIDRLSLGLDYYYGLTSDYEYTGLTLDAGSMTVIESDQYRWKSSRLGLTLYYSFRGKRSE